MCVCLCPSPFGRWNNVLLLSDMMFIKQNKKKKNRKVYTNEWSRIYACRWYARTRTIYSYSIPVYGWIWPIWPCAKSILASARRQIVSIQIWLLFINIFIYLLCSLSISLSQSFALYTSRNFIFDPVPKWWLTIYYFIVVLNLEFALQVTWIYIIRSIRRTHQKYNWKNVSIKFDVRSKRRTTHSQYPFAYEMLSTYVFDNNVLNAAPFLMLMLPFKHKSVYNLQSTLEFR